MKKLFILSIVVFIFINGFSQDPHTHYGITFTYHKSCPDIPDGYIHVSGITCITDIEYKLPGESFWRDFLTQACPNPNSYYVHHSIAYDLPAGTLVRAKRTGSAGWSLSVSLQEHPDVYSTSTSKGNCEDDDNLYTGINGTATITPSGGLAPYSYLWDADAGNQTTQTATSLEQGGYSYTVTDANGCTHVGSQYVYDVDVDFSISYTNPCPGDENGEIVATPQQTGYYDWEYEVDDMTTTFYTLTSFTREDLAADNYRIKLKKLGCESNNQWTLLKSLTATLACGKCYSRTGVKITANAANGNPSYSYSWSNGRTTAENCGIQIWTTYTVTVTDAEGCTFTTSGQCLGTSKSFADFGVNIYPNPNNGIFTVDATKSDDTFVLEVTNMLGEVVIKKEISGSEEKINLNDQPNGIYLVRAMLGDEMIIEKIIKE